MFVGAKMLISDFYKIPIAISLVMVVSILASSVLASVLFPPAEERAAVLPGKAEERKEPEEERDA
jgi:predicted tellurium resistance membrane protein TerC